MSGTAGKIAILEDTRGYIDSDVLRIAFLRILELLQLLELLELPFLCFLRLFAAIRFL